MRFTKMHALGNDFIIIEHSQLKTVPSWTPEVVSRLCDRHRGIGADQLLVITSSQDTHHCQIYNTDGTTAQHCGNGLRCVIEYLFSQYPSSDKLSVQVGKLHIEGLRHPDGIAVTMGILPVWHRDLGGSLHGSRYEVVEVGNLHAVFFKDEVYSSEKLITYGETLNGVFTEGINVSWAMLNAHIELAVYERGVGLTHACGSAAVATAFLAHQIHGGSYPLRVSFTHGEVTVSEQQGKIWLTGPTTEVFTGEVNTSWWG